MNFENSHLQETTTETQNLTSEILLSQVNTERFESQQFSPFQNIWENKTVQLGVTGLAGISGLAVLIVGGKLISSFKQNIQSIVLDAKRTKVIVGSFEESGDLINKIGNTPIAKSAVDRIHKGLVSVQEARKRYSSQPNEASYTMFLHEYAALRHDLKSNLPDSAFLMEAKPPLYLQAAQYAREMASLAKQHNWDSAEFSQGTKTVLNRLHRQNNEPEIRILSEDPYIFKPLIANFRHSDLRIASKLQNDTSMNNARAAATYAHEDTHLNQVYTEICRLADILNIGPKPTETEIKSLLELASNYGIKLDRGSIAPYINARNGIKLGEAQSQRADRLLLERKADHKPFPEDFNFATLQNHTNRKSADHNLMQYKTWWNNTKGLETPAFLAELRDVAKYPFMLQSLNSGIRTSLAYGEKMGMSEEHLASHLRSVIQARLAPLESYVRIRQKRYFESFAEREARAVEEAILKAFESPAIKAP